MKISYLMDAWNHLPRRTIQVPMKLEPKTELWIKYGLERNELLECFLC